MFGMPSFYYENIEKHYGRQVAENMAYRGKYKYSKKRGRGRGRRGGKKIVKTVIYYR